MKRTRIVTNMGPSAIGPYSQAIVAGEMVYVSGQIPLDPATGKVRWREEGFGYGTLLD